MSHTETLDKISAPGSSSRLPQWLAVVTMIYVLISAVSLIGTGFKAATGGQAQELFSFASNPYVGLVIGIVATALIQSSSTVSSLIVGMVAGGLPVAIAIPMIMGSNVGTTLTNTLVSLGHVRNKEEFRRAFAAATVHDFFNLIAIVIFLPLEIMFGLLERISAAVAGLLVGDANYSMSGLNFMKILTKPLVGTLEGVSSLLPGMLAGLAMVVIGLALIFLAITWIGKLLKVLMVGKAKAVMHSAIGKGPATGIFSGTLVTIFVQSSSTTTSLMVPLAGAGTFSLRQIYPFMLGANIGTTVTALLAATAVTGAVAAHALEIAIVHVLFNVFAVALIFGLPFLRNLPILGAEWLAGLASERKIYAAVWVLGVFIVVPLLLIAITVLF
ncbi:Na/Pi symporter [Chelativorans sp. YIM 93263]|uniref:Na/Pi symporter n=1 Tax=Chelativorans sp. YIM 93263 TaxID=2906648 RepID=UPI00237913C4|nr:Na/Pi symporter [Chelativorans sp. YIM 93263]